MLPDKKRPAEFEEKEYEIPLYLELCKNSQIWTPGQVLEATVGFDGALYAINSFWKHVGRPKPIDLKLSRLPHLLGLSKRSTGKRRIPPTFRVNLLLQVKRCDAYKSRPHGTRNMGNGPWYSFEINQRQYRQFAQSHLRVNAGPHSPVVDSRYIAPYFWEFGDLARFTYTKRLLKNSNTPTVAGLAGHKRYAYCRAGTNGFRCSKVEGLISPPLFQEHKSTLEADSAFFSDVEEAERTESAAQIVYQQVRNLWYDIMGDIQLPDVREDSLTENCGTIVGQISAELAKRSILWFVQIG